MHKYIFLIISFLSVLDANEYFGELSFIKDLSNIDYNNQEVSNMYYFDFLIGKKMNVYENFLFEPSVGIRGGKSQSDGADYLGYSATLPITYENEGFTSSLFMKYTYIAKFNSFDYDLNNKDNTSLGVKFRLRSSIKYFLIYEHILNNSYMDRNQKNFKFSQDEIGIGIRFNFN